MLPEAAASRLAPVAGSAACANDRRGASLRSSCADESCWIGSNGSRSDCRIGCVVGAFGDIARAILPVDITVLSGIRLPLWTNGDRSRCLPAETSPLAPCDRIFSETGRITSAPVSPLLTANNPEFANSFGPVSGGKPRLGWMEVLASVNDSVCAAGDNGLPDCRCTASLSGPSVGTRGLRCPGIPVDPSVPERFDAGLRPPVSPSFRPILRASTTSFP